MVLYGECSKTQAVVEEIIKTFDKAQIEHAVPGDCSKGAALLLAEERDLLPATSVRHFFPLFLLVILLIFPLSFFLGGRERRNTFRVKNKKMGQLEELNNQAKHV